MKKRLLTVILAATMIVCMACPGVFACESVTETPGETSYTIALALVNLSNSLIKGFVKLAQATEANDVELLVEASSAVIGLTEAAVNALGFEVECSYTDYEVDGVTVSIDPLRVINPLDK